MRVCLRARARARAPRLTPQLRARAEHGLTPPPGPISNHLLFSTPTPPSTPPASRRSRRTRRPTAAAVRPAPSLSPGLRLAEDYRVVSPEVWCALHAWYGGGPLLARAHANVYARVGAVKEEEGAEGEA